MLKLTEMGLRTAFCEHRRIFCKVGLIAKENVSLYSDSLNFDEWLTFVCVYWAHASDCLEVLMSGMGL